jgi:hypothetical protein
MRSEDQNLFNAAESFLDPACDDPGKACRHFAAAHIMDLNVWSLGETPVRTHASNDAVRRLRRQRSQELEDGTRISPCVGEAQVSGLRNGAAQ